MDTHTSIIEEMSQVMEKLALAYMEYGQPEDSCLHCDAYELIERAKVLEDCVPLDEAMEVAR